MDFTQSATDGTGSHDSTWWPGKISLGAWQNLGETSKAEVAELVVFNEVLSTSDRQKIESYLAHKWGLSSLMPNSHPFKSASPIVDPRALDSYSTDLSNLVSGNTYYYRVKATNSQGTDWADQTASFVSKNKLELSSGSLSFNTSGPTPSWTASDGTGGNGSLQTLSWTDASSNTIQYKVAKFSFDSVNIGDGVSVTLTGITPSISMSPVMPPSMQCSMPMVRWAMVFTKVYSKPETSAVEAEERLGVIIRTTIMLLPSMEPGPPTSWEAAPLIPVDPVKKVARLAGWWRALLQVVVDMVVQVPVVKPRAGRTTREPIPFQDRPMVILTWMPCLQVPVVVVVKPPMVVLVRVQSRSQLGARSPSVPIFMRKVARRKCSRSDGRFQWTDLLVRCLR